MFYCDPSVSTDKVYKMLKKIKELGTELHRFALCKDEKLLVEIAPDPYKFDQKAVVYSVSKTYIQLAVGLCYDKGLIELDKRVVDYFPAEMTAETDEKIKRLTVYDMLIMHTQIKDIIADLHKSEDPLKTYLTQKAVADTDEYHYDNTASFMLGVLVKQVTGLNVLELLNRDFFPHLGISGCKWFAMGDQLEGYSGFHVSARDIALTLQVYLNKGMFNGKRLLSEEWATISTSNHISTANDNPHRWYTAGYGFQIWMNYKGNGCRADGSLGQYGYLFPSLGLTAAVEGVVDIIDPTNDTYFEFFSDYEGESNVSTEEIEAFLRDWYKTDEPDVTQFEGLNCTYSLPKAELGFDKITFRSEGDVVKCEFFSTEEKCFTFGVGKWSENLPVFKNFTAGDVVSSIPTVQAINFAARCFYADKNTIKASFRFLDAPLKYTAAATLNGDDITIEFISHSPNRPGTKISKGTKIK